MPEFSFKGKEFVYNHHLSVPFRPLEVHPEKGVGETRLDGNLVIHGDNLHALKALLPMYAGKVDCIFIDPPYNTGNEGWSYNDNVNSPMIREWLDSNPVTVEDGLRHDKWAAMMYPRLKLLHELLSDRGSFWMTLDDNEIHQAALILDEIFGVEQRVATLIWKKMDSPSRNEANRAFSSYHDYLLVYAKDIDEVALAPQFRASILNAYPLTLDDGRLARRRQLRKNGKNARRQDRPTMWYPLRAPDGTEVWPIAPEGWEGRWALSREAWEERGRAGMTEWIRREYGWVPYYIEVAPENPTAPWSTIWDDVGQNRQAAAELERIVGEAAQFETPKPTALIRRILDVIGTKDALVLDSFAGSGTTAHAALAANAKDGGNRQFILVEMEDYADHLTAERVRRVIKGYSFTGIQREELLREGLNWRKLEQANKLIEQVEGLENAYGPAYDRITKSVTNGELVVTGEKRIEERVEGLGGAFTYCTLGDPIDMDRLLTGESLPSFEALAGFLFHTATSTTLDAASMDLELLEAPGHGYLGEAVGVHVWLIYQPDLEFLKSRDAALTLAKARAIAATKEGRHLVFAPARFVSQKILNSEGLPVEFAPLPFALYRVERE